MQRPAPPESAQGKMLMFASVDHLMRSSRFLLQMAHVKKWKEIVLRLHRLTMVVRKPVAQAS